MSAITRTFPLSEPRSVRGANTKLFLGSLFIFSCFFPYPAFSIGASTGVQLSQIVAILMIPFILGSVLSRRALVSTWVIIAPLALTTTVLSLMGRLDSSELAIKSILNLILSVIVMIPATWVLMRYGLIAVISAASAATVVHAAFGGWQALSFGSGVFPFLALYTNPSFANVADSAERIVLYDPRPFGLFPEPSAMAASLGPWLVLFLALAIRPRQLAAPFSRRMRWLMAVAGVSGLALIVVSRSGYVIPLLAALGIAAFGAVKGQMGSRGLGRNLMVAFGVLIAASVTVYVALSLTGSRLLLELGSATGTSYAQRYSSIVDGISVVSADAARIVLGIGAGQAVPVLQHFSANSNGAIYSDAVRYAIEGGIFGLLALLSIALFTVYYVMRSSTRLTGYGCLLAWLAAVILTTSYVSLSPIWAFLGVLLCWDQVFPVSQRAGKLSGVMVLGRVLPQRLRDRSDIGGIG